MNKGLDWDTEGIDWPNRPASRFVEAGGWRWHVQELGQGPVALLVHGTGAATHSWRDVLPNLASDHRVIAVDLPGHGFTRALPRANGDLSLPGMASALCALLGQLSAKPDLAIGHSAGAAILIRMALDGDIQPNTIISINGALMPFRGLAAQVFSPLAKILVMNPFVPKFVAWGANNPNNVGKLLRETGSNIDALGLKLYARLFANPLHVAGTLGMMANWDLVPLKLDIPNLKTRLVLIAASNDRTIPPDDAFKIRACVAGASVRNLRNLGHLAHEERPSEIVALIRAIETEDAGQISG